jgi:protein-disulfide isomerase
MTQKSYIWAAAAVLSLVLMADALLTGLPATGREMRLSLGSLIATPARAQTAIDPAALAPRREGDDMVLGKADAPAVLIEYASLTCPSCARFHNDVLPKLKTQYIDTGLLKFVYRDFPLDRVALQAAQIARCVPTERYFGFLELLFRQQEQWAAGREAGPMIERVKQFASLAGLPRDRATACADDQAMQLKIVATAQAGEKDYKVTGTPALVINGKRHTGAPSFEDVDKALREILRKP